MRMIAVPTISMFFICEKGWEERGNEATHDHIMLWINNYGTHGTLLRYVFMLCKRRRGVKWEDGEVWMS